MAYDIVTYYTPMFNDIEYKFAGKYGAKGEKRAKRRKATPEQIKKQNQRNKEKYMRRLIALNFKAHDLWTTLKYPKGYRTEVDEVRGHLSKFLRKMKSWYKKIERVFKYICRIEVGKKGGIHIHILFNRVEGADRMAQEIWEQGRASFTSLYEEGGCKALAEYIVKQPEEMEGQLSMFPEKDRKRLNSYSSSKNLVRPQPERKHYNKWTLRKLVEKGPTPTPGFYIDVDSIVSGVNPYTGMSYYYYTEYPMKERRASRAQGKHLHDGGD